MNNLNKIIVLVFWALPFWSSAQLSADELYKMLDSLVARPTVENIQRLENSAHTFSSTVNARNEQLTLVIVRCNLGYYLEKNGDLAKSMENYEDAYQRFESNHLSDYDIFENAVVPLAALYTRQGDYLLAEELLRKCAAHAKNTANNSLLFNTVLSLSALYNSTSRYEISYILIKETLKKKDIPLHTGAALKNNLATAYFRIGDFEKAKQLLSEIMVSTGLNHVNAYKSLAFIALKEGQVEIALDYFEKAKTALLTNENASSREWVNLQVEEAELLLEIGNIPEAQNILQNAMSVLLPSHSGNALPDKSILYPDRNFLRIFDVYASTTTSLVDALGAYDLANYVTNLLQQEYISQETKMIHRAVVKHRTEKCIDLLWKRYSDTNEQVWAQRAFTYAEQGKASVLMERNILNKENDENSYENTFELKKLLRKRDKLTDQLLRAQFKNLDDQVLETFSSELADVARQIKISQSNLPNPLRPEINLTDLQQRLKTDDAVLQSYFLGTRRNYQFIINDSGIQMLRLPDTEELTPLILEFVHLFDGPEAINNDVLNFTKIAHRMFEVLQLKKGLYKKHLVLIPDGLLNFLPFESLLTEPTNGMSFSKMPFLAVSQKVAYAVNAKRYLDSENNSKIKSILGIFPIFKGSSDELSYSEDEAKALQDNMSAELILESQATKTNFIEKAKKHVLIHLSTHAASGNFVVPAHVQFYDDLLYLPELHSLDMYGKTIILSACETGIGKLQKGEGAISIARGFQYAGASSVLFSIWKVNDQSTASVMSRFYESFKETGSVFESNHIAKLSYLKDITVTNTKKSPYYWNGFAYYGAIASSEKSNNSLWWWGGLILFLGFLIFLLSNRKK
ncbi:CHAT domain-containing protein [Arenibacter sp. F26102]|uniref:CHAT domain-containing protein n=1 Tax=Arenibacter sp. F26102 TaxID=2926416 RepID=UPI001FF3959D|nr:CHAT domain-containing tetratricopeptide repeat protein [Arenibacter sp. F26102]MCK0145498.1 CHAT domain-containing protein [Arenibacter sp. F26102]